MGTAAWPQWAGGATSAREAGTVQVSGNPDTEAKGEPRGTSGKQGKGWCRDGKGKTLGPSAQAPEGRGRGWGAHLFARTWRSPEELAAGSGLWGPVFCRPTCRAAVALPCHQPSVERDSPCPLCHLESPGAQRAELLPLDGQADHPAAGGRLGMLLVCADCAAS